MGCSKLMLKSDHMYPSNPYLQRTMGDGEYSLVAECLTSKPEAPGSILNTAN